MIVPGIVTNITKFGAFVDIGIKQMVSFIYPISVKISQKIPPRL